MFLKYKIYLFFFVKLLVLGVFCANSFAQSPTKAPKNTREYIDIIKYYRYLNPDSAKFFVEKGLAAAKLNKDELGIAALLNQAGMIADNATRFEEARDKYLQAEIIYRQNNEEIGLASTLIRLSVVQYRKGNFDKSLAYAMNALKLSEKNKDILGTLEARIVFSEIYYRLEDYQQALENLTIAENLDRKIPLSNFSFNMYISFGYVYIKLKNYQKAIDYLQLGLSRCKKIEYNGLKTSMLKVLGTASFKNGNKTQAIAYFKQAINLAREIKNVLREQSTLVDLSEVYMSDEPDTALAYLKEALQIVEKSKLYHQQINILKRMSGLYQKKGDLSTALSLMQKSYDLSDEFYYKDMAKQISSLESAYELEKSNAQLRELKLKNNQEKLQKNIILYIAIGTFLILLVTLIFYFRAKHLNRLLKDTNLELEESHDVKDKFFSIVAHDIRSPLASTIGFLNLVNDDDIDEETRSNIVQKLIIHSKSSLSILDKLLKWGQMQIKGLRLNITKFNALTNINRNLSLFKDMAEKKRIQLEINVPENIELTADSDHFDFVVRNLLSNAIKFTEINGRVSLNTQVIKDKVQFSVVDNGVGIHPSRVEKIFQLSAISTKGTSQEVGTSLGLVICKEFILANHGELSVESELGKGTTFIFTLDGKET